MRGNLSWGAGTTRFFAALGLTLALVGLSTQTEAQEAVPERNVNVIGGPTSLELEQSADGTVVLKNILGNPFRNPVVEPSCAVDTRNPAVIVCGAVDYRLVDLDGVGAAEHPDSSNMVAQSRDGGLTWVSTLHPGHSLDPEPNVLSQFDFFTDPIWVAGAAGIFYNAGLVGNREDVKPGKGPPHPLSGIYVSTWIHLSNREDDDQPVKLVNISLPNHLLGTAGQFVDRETVAVGEPNGQTCTFEVPRGDGTTVTQTIPATPVYLAFTTFVGQGNKVNAELHFTKSEDCGRTWRKLIKVSEGSRINVGAQIVKLPGSARIFLFWRRGASKKQSDAIMFATSNDEGDTFSKKRVYTEICPFDQPTSATMFRSRTVPAATADKDRAYVVWADRRDPLTGLCTAGDATLNEARIVISTTTNGRNGTVPARVDSLFAGPGHQIRPTVALGGNKVHVAWLDFRNDASQVFQEFIDETPIIKNDPNVLSSGIRRRHTADMFAAEADAVADPAFEPSQQISQYIFGKPNPASGIPSGESGERQQLQWNVTNVRTHGEMRIVFGGDYDAIASESIVPLDPINQPGEWASNGAPGTAPFTPVFHRFWPDARGMRILADEAYGDPIGSIPRFYTPPDLNSALTGLSLSQKSLFDPTQDRPVCDPDSTGTRKIEIYSSRSTHGFYAFAPWNNKAMLTPEGDSVQRAFVIVVQNTNPAPNLSVPDRPPETGFRLRIVNQPAEDLTLNIPGRASFVQFSVNPDSGETTPAVPVVEENVVIRAGSARAFNVFVTSSNPRAAVRVDVEKLNDTGDVAETRAVFLNPDPSAPENPLRPGNVDQTAPEFDIDRVEVHDLDISEIEIQDINVATTGGAPPVPQQGTATPGWDTPGWDTPGWDTPGWDTPGWDTPGWDTPGWDTPGWETPGWDTTAVSAGDIAAGETRQRQIRTRYTNMGNTTSTYDARALINGLSDDRALQLVCYELYTTTPTDGCAANLVGNTQVLVNIPDYDASLASFTDPAKSDATFALAPGEQAYCVLIVHATETNPDPTEVDPGIADVVFQGIPEAVDTVDLVPGVVPEPEPVISQLFIVAASLPDGQAGFSYPATGLQALGGAGAFTWTIAAGSLPPGLGLNTFTGIISGLPTTSGTFDFTVQVQDSDSPPHFATQAFNILVNPGPPDHLALLFGLVQTTTGQEFFPTATVLVQDAFSNTVTSATNLITMSLRVNPPGDGTLLGMTLKNSVGGVAVFDDLGIDKVGNGYTLLASSPGLGGAESNPFNITPGVPKKFGFVVQPTNTPAGATLSPPVEVEFQDEFGNRSDFINGVNATLSIGNNPGGGTLSGTATVAAVDGVSIFSDLSIDQAGIGYTLIASGGVIAPATSPAFDIGLPLTTGFVGPYEMQNWSTTGITAGTTSITPAVGPTSNAAFGYNVFLGNPAGGVTLRTATYSTAAAATGQVSFDWQYSFFHAFFKVTAIFKTFAGSSSGTIENTELNFANLSFTGSQTFSGSATLNVEDGFGFGFIVGGSNFDSNSTLAGTLTISNFRAPLGFADTGGMGAARLEHTATLLPDGKVLVAGGVTGGGAVLSSAELHDPATGSFTTTGPMTSARELHRATLLPGGKVLITGGFDGGSTLAGAELYDPTTGTFALTNSMSIAHLNHTATLLSNGKVLVAGGSDSPTTAELYDPASGTFGPTGTLNAPRADHTATLLPDGKVLISGSSLGGVLASAELYDPAAGNFSATGSMGTARLDHTAMLLPDGRVLVTGGFDGVGSTLASAELYDSAAGTFTAAPVSMSTARRLHTATRLLDGTVLIAGGASGSGVASSAELYDPVSDSFSSADTMSSARQSHRATLLFDGRVLITGGGGTAPLATAELYQPDTAGGPLTIVADSPVAVFGSPTPQVVRLFTDRSLFEAALAGSSTLEENFDSLASGTPVTTIFPGVLDVGSTFANLEVFSGGVLFGFDTTTRIAGNGRYDLPFVPPATHGNLGFDIASQDPATLPAQVEVRTSAGNVIFLVSNISGNENIPTFVGLISSLPIESVIIREGPEFTGTGNEEVALDNFTIVIP